MIPVTKPFMPPFNEVEERLRGVWDREWLTNNGPLVNEFEASLKKFLQVDRLVLVGNGTIALQIAIKALGLKGKIITTPFSYVATTSSIVWEGCEPVFVDIDKRTFNIDPERIESAITTDTSAILATHCFGNPCDIDAIQTIARKYSLFIIYDAAHCFGSTYKGKSVFDYGDISTASLHATKLIHSVEGGILFSKNPELISRMTYMRNFGHDGPEKFNGVGINGKNSELHAAVGLVVLRYASLILAKRKEQSQYYDTHLADLELVRLLVTPGGGFNYAYYPVIFRTTGALMKALDILNKNEIFPRRYFYPSLSTLEYVRAGNCPIACDISSRVLCLPLFDSMSTNEQDLICGLLRATINR